MYFSPSPSKSPKNKNEENKKRPYKTIDQPQRSVNSFSDLRISKYTSSIIIRNKKIHDFVGLPELNFLTQLQLDSNPIKSFKGAPRLPSLRWLSMKNSPISRNIHFKLMCIIVFGEGIQTINNQHVTEKLLKQAKVIEDDLYPELIKGRVVSNLKPLRLIDMNESCYVPVNNSLMEASIKMGYMSPSDLEYTKAIIQPEVIPQSIPSIASICDEIIERESDTCYIPHNIMEIFKQQLHDLRVAHNAKYQNFESESEINIQSSFETPIKNPTNSSMPEDSFNSQTNDEIFVEVEEGQIDEAENYHESKSSNTIDVPEDKPEIVEDKPEIVEDKPEIVEDKPEIVEGKPEIVEEEEFGEEVEIVYVEEEEEDLYEVIIEEEEEEAYEDELKE